MGLDVSDGSNGLMIFHNSSLTNSFPILARVALALDTSCLRDGPEGVPYRVDRSVHEPGHHEVP